MTTKTPRLPRGVDRAMAREIANDFKDGQRCDWVADNWGLNIHQVEQVIRYELVRRDKEAGRG